MTMHTVGTALRQEPIVAISTVSRVLAVKDERGARDRLRTRLDAEKADWRRAGEDVQAWEAMAKAAAGEITREEREGVRAVLRRPAHDRAQVPSCVRADGSSSTLFPITELSSILRGRMTVESVFTHLLECDNAHAAEAGSTGGIDGAAAPGDVTGGAAAIGDGINTVVLAMHAVLRVCIDQHGAWVPYIAGRWREADSPWCLRDVNIIFPDSLRICTAPCRLTIPAQAESHYWAYNVLILRDRISVVCVDGMHRERICAEVGASLLAALRDRWEYEIERLRAVPMCDKLPEWERVDYTPPTVGPRQGLNECGWVMLEATRLWRRGQVASAATITPAVTDRARTKALCWLACACTSEALRVGARGLDTESFGESLVRDSVHERDGEFVGSRREHPDGACFRVLHKGGARTLVHVDGGSAVGAEAAGGGDALGANAAPQQHAERLAHALRQLLLGSVDGRAPGSPVRAGGDLAVGTAGAERAARGDVRARAEDLAGTPSVPDASQQGRTHLVVVLSESGLDDGREGVRGPPPPSPPTQVDASGDVKMSELDLSRTAQIPARAGGPGVDTAIGVGAADASMRLETGVAQGAAWDPGRTSATGAGGAPPVAPPPASPPPPPKPPALRPIAISECIVRLAAKCALIREQSNLGEVLDPWNLGVGTSAEPGVHFVRAQLALGRWATMVDLTNAFNRCNRRALLNRAAQCVPRSFRFIRWLYGGDSDLLMRGDGGVVYRIASQEGTRQGDPLSPLLFTLVIRPALRKLREELLQRFPEIEQPIINYLDDITIITPDAAAAAWALDRISVLLAPVGGLLNRAKCHTISPDTAELFSLLGGFIGNMDLAQERLMDELDGIEQRVSETSKWSPQCALLVLRYCWSALWSYKMRVNSLDVMQKAAQRFADILRQGVATLIDVACVDFTPFQKITLELPPRFGGLGIPGEVYATCGMQHAASVVESIAILKSRLGHTLSVGTLSVATRELIRKGAENINVASLDDLWASPADKLTRLSSKFMTRVYERLQLDRYRFLDSLPICPQTSALRILTTENECKTPLAVLRAIPDGQKPEYELSSAEFKGTLRCALAIPMRRDVAAGYCSICGVQLSTPAPFGVPSPLAQPWTEGSAQLAEHHAAACTRSGNSQRCARSTGVVRILAQAAFADNRVFEREPLLSQASGHRADLRMSAPGPMSGPKQPTIPEFIDVKVIENTPLKNHFKDFRMPPEVGHLDTQVELEAFKQARATHAELAFAKHQMMAATTIARYRALGFPVWPFVVSSRGAATKEVDASIPKAGNNRRGRARARVHMSIILHKARFAIIKEWAERQSWGGFTPHQPAGQPASPAPAAPVAGVHSDDE